MANTRENQTDAPTQAPESGSRLQGSQQGGQQLQQHEGGAVQHGREAQHGGLTRWSRDPFEMVQRLSDEMDEVFNSMLHGRPSTRWSGHGGGGLRNFWAPEVEIAEEGNQLRVCVDLPGVSKDNVKVDVHEGMLTIQGERREERTEGGEQQGFRRSERRYGSFYRAIPLPEGAAAENAQASMKEGVLTVTVPIARKRARRLEIQG